jgi:hypothetical protein
MVGEYNVMAVLDVDPNTQQGGVINFVGLEYNFS